MNISRHLLAIVVGVISGAAGATTSQEALLLRLAADHDALARAEAAFRALNPTVGSVEHEDFEGFVSRLRDRVMEDCAGLAQAGYAGVIDDPRCQPFAGLGSAGTGLPRIGSEQTTAERMATLDAELNQALGRFDDMLLQEEQRVKADRPVTGPTGAAGGGGGEGAGESETEAEAGVATGATRTQSDGERGGEGASGADGAATQAGAAPAGASGDAAGRGGDQRAAARAPEDIPDGSDDDVVARQLREAAEKETDPELKAKLWEEYRRYKAGSG